MIFDPCGSGEAPMLTKWARTSEGRAEDVSVAKGEQQNPARARCCAGLSSAGAPSMKPQLLVHLLYRSRHTLWCRGKPSGTARFGCKGQPCRHAQTSNKCCFCSSEQYFGNQTLRLPRPQLQVASPWAVTSGQSGLVLLHHGENAFYGNKYTMILYVMILYAMIPGSVAT